MPAYTVGTIEEILEDSHKVVQIENRSIGVYNVKGTYYAIHNYCPHQGAEICQGLVCGTTLPSEVHQYSFGRQGEIVRCPWHGWEFDIKTGKSLFSDKVRIRSYPVVVENGQISVVLGG
ncbi:Rieske (2Fe-2S) protein [Paenibacillus roseipurpureus]|uniref:Rieske (2Fe-2S) protein n=1 Tax=Paenibacillus roseopurpureus TaxID=2918901 RepID=A0AA96RLU3_9BACL|nr:Rieske (2Fe-2S) protein [Paenibacillus sp. MBLB1832]WNR46040.1 Rieske (2Fe-2S) protein [Paenibacillus sp. MBLB1832]